MVKAKALQPKRAIRNTHPLLEHRIAAARNGWTQNPCTLKGQPCRRWNKIASDEVAILAEKDWRDLHWQGTAVRVVGELCVYDSDISDQVVADAVLDDFFEIDPDAFNAAIMRDSGRAKVALFFRCATPFRHYKTHKYTAHPELIQGWLDAHAMPVTSEAEHEAKVQRLRELTAGLDAQFVEIYGPLSKARYFQFEGPHSEGRDYHCGDRAPWNTKVSDLPLLPIEPSALIDRADAVLAKHLTLIPDAPSDGLGEVVYDLTPEMLFYPHGGEADAIEDLTAGLQPGAENGIRGCLPTTLVSVSQANCNLYVSSSTGRIVVTEWSADGRKHYMASEKPPPHMEINDEMRAALAALQPPAEEPVEDAPTPRAMREDITRASTDEESHGNAVIWLLENVAYFANAFRGRGGAISIHHDGEWPTPITVTSLRAAMASYSWTEIGPRGGLKVHNPVAAWGIHPEQVNIYGVRMRPELPRPLFREEGLLLINRYAPPQHPTKGGDIKPFLQRMHDLLPVEMECAWFLNWCRLLVQKPHWRMIAVAMVAGDNGTGRGLLAETLQLVLGKQFTVSMPYANISGGSHFNAEVEDRLLLYVNEAAPADGHKFHARNSAREALKDFVEPNHNLPFRVEGKGQDAYYTKAAVSTLIFTNNVNGLPLDDADRRFAVMMNGPQMTSAEVAVYRAWMEVPANIGALYRWLRDSAVESNKEVFDPYISPSKFEGRAIMIDAGKTALDHAWDAAAAKMVTATELYTASQMVAVARYFAKTRNSDFDDLARKHTFLRGSRIGVKRPHEKNWLTRYGGGEDNREPVFAFSTEAARRWTKAEPHQIKQQLDKAQKVVDAPTKAFNKALRIVDKEAPEA